MNTIKSLLDDLGAKVKNGQSPSPGVWLDYAAKINALMHEIDSEYVDAEIAYRKIKAGFLMVGKSASYAEAMAKASNEYKTFLEKKALRDRIISFIQIAKKRSETKLYDL